MKTNAVLIFVYFEILISTLKTSSDILYWNNVLPGLHTIYLFFRTYLINFLALLCLALSQTVKVIFFSWRCNKMESCIGCNNIKISQIDSSAMLCTIFISFVAEIGVKNEKNRVSRMWEKAYSSIKTPKASRALDHGC